MDMEILRPNPASPRAQKAPAGHNGPAPEAHVEMGPFHPVFLFLAGIMTFLAFFLGGLKEASAAPYTPPNQREQEEIAAARGMEALFVNQMIEQMRKTVPENELIPKSQGERIFESMLDTEYSQKIAEGGNFGIAERVLAQIRRKR